MRRKSELHVQFVFFLLIRSVSLEPIFIVVRLSSPFSITRFNFFCLHVSLTRASLSALAKSIYYASTVWKWTFIKRLYHWDICLMVLDGGWQLKRGLSKISKIFNRNFSSLPKQKPFLTTSTSFVRLWWFRVSRSPKRVNFRSKIRLIDGGCLIGGNLMAVKPY